MNPQESARVQCVDTLDGVEALAGDWAALESATPEATGFQSFVWCRTWLRLTGARPRIVCVYETGRLVLLAPFQIERRFGVRVARWVGEPIAQYGDALARPGPDRARWRAAAMAEIAGWRDVDLVALTRLRADGVLSDGRTDGEPLAAPFADLLGWAPRRRKSMDRRARRLAARGPVALVEARTGAESERLARHALALKREWLRCKGAYSAGLSHPLAEEFVAALARAGFLRANALMVGGEAAALDLGFLGGDAYRSFLGCYDARFADGAPGHALTGRLIARYAGEGLRAYDMLAPADAYKLAWATGQTPIESRFVALNLRGRAAAFALARLRPLAKRAVQGLARLGLLPAFSFARFRARLASSQAQGATR